MVQPDPEENIENTATLGLHITLTQEEQAEDVMWHDKTQPLLPGFSLHPGNALSAMAPKPPASKGLRARSFSGTKAKASLTTRGGGGVSTAVRRKAASHSRLMQCLEDQSTELNDWYMCADCNT